MSTYSFYFIAIIPPSPLFEKIHQIKLFVAQKYFCKQALKSPPHITIIPPFRYQPNKESFLFHKIQALNHQLSAPTINITLNGYDVFLPKVIFVNILPHPSLTQLYEHTQSYVKKELNIIKDLLPRPFHPHITVAFRDIKKSFTISILNDLQQHFPIHEHFTYQQLSLLKHNGKNWNVIL